MVDLRQRLTDQQWRVTQEAATDRPFTGEYDDHFEDGQYKCICCGKPLFASEEKYNSGCGWPAFTAPQPDAVKEQDDRTFGMVRTEVVCQHCGAHLGHVFPDGPPEQGGMRYCINSSSLDFTPREP